MKIFTHKGGMRVPEQKKPEGKPKKKPIVLKECYCPNGHNIIDPKNKFNNLSAITIGLKNKKQKGLLIINPTCGNKNSVTIGIDIKNKVIYEFYCPECGIELPNYAHCHCKGDLKILFTTPKLDYNHFVGICNRTGCNNSIIKKGDELFDCSDINLL